MLLWVTMRVSQFLETLLKDAGSFFKTWMPLSPVVTPPKPEETICVTHRDRMEDAGRIFGWMREKLPVSSYLLTSNTVMEADIMLYFLVNFMIISGYRSILRIYPN